MTRGGPRPNSGRKSKAEELGLTAMLDKAWPESSRIKFFSELAKLAENPRTMQGMEAGKLLSAYTYGKPTEKQDHSGSISITVNYADVAPPASSASDDQSEG